MRSPLILGSRGSKLALWQAHFIKNALERRHSVQVRIEVIRTTGDKITDVPLAQVGGTKALFTKEIEEALADRRIDLAVHSLKDMPSVLPAGLTVAAIPAREDARDALITRHGYTWERLPQGARVGTSSLRRRLQLVRLRKDLTIEPLRGNLDTRLRKLDEGQYDAIVVALAGLRRMGWEHRATQAFSPEEMMPAIGQGALAIEARLNDSELLEGLEFLRDPDTEAATKAERAFLARLGGGCQVPIAAHASIKRDRLHLAGLVMSLDGSRAIRGSEEGEPSAGDTIGKVLAEGLLQEGAAEILATIGRGVPGLPGGA